MSELITLQDIANLYGVSYRFARDQLTKRQGFPRPIPGCTPRKRMWLKEHIEAYWRGVVA